MSEMVSDIALGLDSDPSGAFLEANGSASIIRGKSGTNYAHKCSNRYLARHCLCPRLKST